MSNTAHDDTNLLAYAHHYEHIANGTTSLFSLALFGKHCGDSREIDWTLPATDDCVRNKTARILTRMGACIYYAPNASVANARRVPRSRLRNRVPIPGVRIFGNRREPGEVVMLEQNEGVVFNPAGCGVIFAEYEYACAGHSGWRSFIDDDRVCNRATAWRMNESVTETVIRAVKGLRHSRGIRVWLRGFIRPEHLRFPLVDNQWAERNAVRLAYIRKHWGSRCIRMEQDGYCLDLAALAAAQFDTLGVRNVDLTHAYLPATGVWTDGTEGAPRNLFVAVRS